MHQRFLKYKFQWEFEEFIEDPERFETFGCSASGGVDTQNVSAVGDADLETYELQRTSLTNQQDELDEDFEEEDFHPLGFVKLEEPECSEFCYTEFVNAMGLSENVAEEEVQVLSYLEVSNSQNEKNPSKRPRRMKLRKRRRTMRTPKEATLDGRFEKTSSDSSYSQESDSDYETMARKVGLGRRKTRLERKEALRGPTPIVSSTFGPHKQNHPKEKQFKCSVCPNSFLYASCLRQHQLNHTNERPHKCWDCEKSFRQAAHLRTYELLHAK